MSRRHSSSWPAVVLVLIDLMGFFAAIHLAIWLRYSIFVGAFIKQGPPPWPEILDVLPFVAVSWIAVNASVGSYRQGLGALDEFSSLLRATILTFLGVLSAHFFYREASYSRAMIGFLIPLLLFVSLASRLVLRMLRRRALTKFGGTLRVLVVGEDPTAQGLIQGMIRLGDQYKVIGSLSVGPRKTQGILPVLGEFEDLEEVCQRENIDTLVIAERELGEDKVLSSIEVCLRNQVAWNMVPRVHELLVDRARVDLVDGIPLVGMRRTNIVGFNWMLKRALDIVASSVLLLVGSPLMIGVAIAIRISSKGPIFYVQERVGYRGQLFPFIKFRSMHLNNDNAIHRDYTRQWITENKAHTEGGEAKEAVHKIIDDPRIFKVGKFIRRYSVDELPQLFNVFRGDMSLIGPRPALAYEVEVYSEWHRRRFEAPPGITGLWQVSGRNRLSFEQMVELDIEYLENWTLGTDLRILIRTVSVVLFEKAY
ncbi:MAG: sugar transferase [Deltaproteobacteria bacterium]|nr:sugar transferase [Deltaproteobacteria bacterium]MBT6489405.1 sugar transferase [Deltaproteobacteria bacterium]